MHTTYVNLQILIDEAFKIRGAKYLYMDRLGSAYWAQTGCAKLNISKDLLIEYLVISLLRLVTGCIDNVLEFQWGHLFLSFDDIF